MFLWKKKRAREVIKRANLEGETYGQSYHKITFPDNTVLNGVWDMSKYLKNYNIPEDLSGKTVLDVGAKTGYFSFEFAKRGAKKVVALDNVKNRVIKSANQLMNTNVKIIKKDLFRLNEGFGKFDLVFCSNVLIHVKDIFTAICKLREVTRNQIIIGTVILDFNEFPFAEFLGVEKKIPAGSFWSYWQPNFKCLQKMMEVAGFNKIEPISNFIAISEDGKRKVRLGVIHGFV